MAVGRETSVLSGPPLSAVMEGMTGLLVLMGLFGLGGAGMTYVGCYRFTGQDTPLVHKCECTTMVSRVLEKCNETFEIVPQVLLFISGVMTTVPI